jgi:murein DD-endopeptidase MepM/ murein hydrolase activator NlpD
MIQHKQILIIICLIFILSSAFTSPPNNSGNNDKKGNISKEKKDKEEMEEEDEEEEDEDHDEHEHESDTIPQLKYLSSYDWDINDSLLNIPAYDIYCNWNTQVIHPYKYDVTKKRDTTVINLTDEESCGYFHPIEGHITSQFGPRGGRYHYGIDIKLQTGDSVYCAFDGAVRIAQRSKTYGNVVVVRHKNGLETLYAHLEKISVEVGENIYAGEVIGLGGNTGRSTGSHLHFEVRFKGEPINPNDLICFSDYKLKTDIFSIHSKNFDYLVKARTARYHTIKSGDTLSKVAKKYGTSVSALCRLNGIKPSTILRTGKKLRYA